MTRRCKIPDISAPFRRYTDGKKRSILEALEKGLISEKDAMRVHNLSFEEITYWKACFLEHGLRGLRALSHSLSMTKALNAVSNMTWADEPHEGRS